MKSLLNMIDQPVSIPLRADDIVEFHAARLLLLLKICGVKERKSGLARIEGLTKMAKLDFFVRYPAFFAVVCGRGGEADMIESRMVRHHYGPWDKRYYHVLAYLEGRGLIKVTHDGRRFTLAITEAGDEITREFTKDAAFDQLRDQMGKVRKMLGKHSGAALKKMIYKVFVEEITNRTLGEEIV